MDRREVVAALMASGIVGLVESAKAGYVNVQISGPGYVVPATRWLLGNFGDAIKAKTAGTPFSYRLLCAMAYQESGYFWWRKKFLRDKTPEQVLRLIVLDEVAPRKAFPRDTAAFQADPRFAKIATVLTAASDAARAEQGVAADGRLRFGYGLFQNDLQNIVASPDFWTGSSASSPNVQGRWGDIGACTNECLRELKGKYEANGGDVYRAVRAYNGGGTSADIYLENVRIYEGAILKGGL